MQIKLKVRLNINTRSIILKSVNKYRMHHVVLPTVNNVRVVLPTVNNVVLSTVNNLMLCCQL